MYNRFRKWGLTTPRSELPPIGDAILLNVPSEIPGNEDEATLSVALNNSTLGTPADAGMYHTITYSSLWNTESSTYENQTNLISDTEVQLDSSQDAMISAESTPAPANVAPTTVDFNINNRETDVVVQNHEAHLSNLAPSDEKSDTQPSKRPRSLVSSVRSSWSTDMQSFAHLSKRLRHLPSAHSLTSSLKRLSMGSSHKSWLLGGGIDHGPDLDTVIEMPEDRSDKHVAAKTSSNATQRLQKLSSQNKSSLSEEFIHLWAGIFQKESAYSCELSWVDIENVNDYLRILSLDSTPVWKLRPKVKSLPAVDAKMLAEFSSQLPWFRGVAIPHQLDPMRRYLIVGQHQIHALDGEVPLLGFQVG